MVKGISKQVVLVRPQDHRTFEQAIFILRDGAEEGVSEQELLRQAEQAAAGRSRGVRRAAWLALGALLASGVWTAILLVAGSMKI